MSRGRRVLATGTAIVVVLVAGVAVALGAGPGRPAGRRVAAERPTPGAAPTLAGGPSSAGSGTSTGYVAPPLRWAACGGGFQCATLVVPLDYAHPGGTKIDEAVIRAPATDPSASLGDLVVNPGGPGASGVQFLREGLSIFPAAVRARYTIVSFDPRGVGSSDPVVCLTPAQVTASYDMQPIPQDPAQRAALVAAARLEDRACAKREAGLIPYVGTNNVARDLDVLRAALGERKLTYLGYSYGTYLGTVYDEMFPTHVRAMVLDGAVDPTMDGRQFLTGQALGFQTDFDNFISWCAAQNDQTCPFRAAGAGSAGLVAAYDALYARVSQAPLPTDPGAPAMGPGDFFTSVIGAMYDPAQGWPFLGIALEQAEQGSGADLEELFTEYSGYGTPDYVNSVDANTAVNCRDRPWPRHLSTYVHLATQLAARAPQFGAAIAYSGLSCLDWPLPPAPRPGDPHALGAPPVVIIGTTRDPATPYAWALALHAELAGSRLITHVGDGHTVYRAGAPACVVNAVDSYLFSLTLPPVGLTCTGTGPGG